MTKGDRERPTCPTCGAKITEAQAAKLVTERQAFGAAGGRARAESLSTADRSRIAKRAAKARWKKVKRAGR